MDIAKKIERDVSRIALEAYIKDVKEAIKLLDGNKFLANVLQFRFNKNNDSIAGLSWLLEYRRHEIYDADKEFLNFSPLRVVYESAVAEEYVNRMTKVVNDDYEKTRDTILELKGKVDLHGKSIGDTLQALEGIDSAMTDIKEELHEKRKDDRQLSDLNDQVGMLRRQLDSLERQLAGGRAERRFKTEGLQAYVMGCDPVNGDVELRTFQKSDGGEHDNEFDDQL